MSTWKSLSRGIESGWKNFSNAVAKAADKSFDKVSHGTFDKSDHWRSEYSDEDTLYDLKLRRDKSMRESDGPKMTGRFKFSCQRTRDGEAFTAEGRIEYLAGELLLRPEWWLSRANAGATDERQVKFEVDNSVSEPVVGNGCYRVPGVLLEMRCVRMTGERVPTFKVTMHVPNVAPGGRGGGMTAVRGPAVDFEVYLPEAAEDGGGNADD